MRLEELKSLWRADSPAGDENRQTEAEMMESIRLRAEHFDRRVRRRDWLETAAAALAIVVFAGAMPAFGWLASVGAVLIIGGCVLVVWRLHRTRMCHTEVGVDRPVTAVLRAQIRKLDDQINLLEGILWWYVAPIAIGCILVVAGLRGWSWFTVIYTLAVVGLGAGVHRMNRRCARNDFRARRRELASMLESMGEQPD